jgi:peptidoglycan hydrolase FlgJ
MALGDMAVNSMNTWTDMSGFGALRHTAQTDANAALPVVAKQFESIFTQMMLKSMRDANFGDKMFGSDSEDQWQDMYDHQLSVSLSQSGKGLGIADMLVRQLGGAAAKNSPGAKEGAIGSDGHPGSGPVPADGWRGRLQAIADATRSAGRAAAKWIPEDAQAFVRAVAPDAIAAAKKLGVSPRVVLAQAALETDWGKHMPSQADGTSSYNMFGIKAGGGWDGGKVNVPTLEYQDGAAVRRQASFRAYQSPAHSFADYADLITNSPRYAQARGKGDDALGFGKALVDGGYATDPGYASKIATIANSPGMRQALEALKNSLQLPNH